MRISDIQTELLPYRGKNIFERLSGAKMRAFLANYNGMRANYAGTVDAALLENQILLCDETRELLYSRSWTKTDYREGSRPILEDTVKEITAENTTELEKALSIIRFCRDLYKKFRGRMLFDGGTEEELIKKGEQLCECLARLAVSLCEIVGIAGRIITHCGAGHLTCELYTD